MSKGETKMLMTTLEEAVNGWILTIYGLEYSPRVFIYERLIEAQEHRNQVETKYETGKFHDIAN